MTPAKRGRDALDEGKKSTQRGREGSEDEDEDEVCRKRSRSEVLIVALEVSSFAIPLHPQGSRLLTKRWM